MKIFKESSYEEIHVFHNDVNEMHNTIQKLIEDGWSENTRSSISGLSLVRERVLAVESFKRNYPDVKIHKDKPGFLSYGDYVYYTVHIKDNLKGGEVYAR